MKNTERLDKVLSHLGKGSRRELRIWARQGRIMINGTIIRDSGIKIDPEQDQVMLDGEPIVYRRWVYLMLNKPQGVISATTDRKEKTVLDLLHGDFEHMTLFPVGRLDKDTTGLLLLTNDGPLAHRLLSPRKGVDKTYEALLEGVVTEDDCASFAAGITLEDGYTTLPATLRVHTIDHEAQQSTVSIVIQEGKYHQVKRMAQAIGKRVLTLKRVRMGDLQLDSSLEPGQYRELSEEEIAWLRAAGL